MIDIERLTAEFARQAAIASPSLREGAMALYLSDRFRRLGGEVFFDAAGAQVGGETGNMIVSFPAAGRSCEPLMLSVHMDTVSPAEGVRPVLRDGVFYSAGETVLGADDKAGITEVIEALEVIREQNIPRGPIEVVVTICEEMGLLGAKHLDFGRIASRRGFALDTAGIDRVIHKAPCADKLRFEIRGREAHAGIAPEQGISAIETAARAIAAMRLGRIDEETTANIGVIRGGESINIVPRQVVVEGEARSHDPEKLSLQSAHMVECFEQAARQMTRTIEGRTMMPQVTTEVLADYPKMEIPLDRPVVELVRQASSALDREVTIEAAGGGSDANVFNDHGIETLILGTGMRDVHTVEESVSVADMARVSELLVEIIRRA